MERVLFHMPNTIILDVTYQWVFIGIVLVKEQHVGTDSFLCYVLRSTQEFVWTGNSSMVV